MKIVWFSIVFLCPLIPSLFIYWKLGKEEIIAEAQGKHGIFSYRASGAIAVYLILCFFSIFVFYILTEFSKFLAFHWYAAIYLLPAIPSYIIYKKLGTKHEGVSAEASFKGFVFKTSGAFAVYIIICGFSSLTFYTIQKRYPEGIGMWETELDISVMQYTGPLSSSEAKQIYLFTNTGKKQLSFLDFFPYIIPGIQTFEIKARRMSLDQKKSVLNKWNKIKKNFLSGKNQSIEDLSDKYDGLYSSFFQSGKSLGYAKFNTVDVYETKGKREQDGNVYLLENYAGTPRLEGISPSIKEGESVLVLISIRSLKEKLLEDLSADLGHRYRYNTKESVLLVINKSNYKINKDDVRIEISKPDGSKDFFRNPKSFFFEDGIFVLLNKPMLESKIKLTWQFVS